MDLWTALETLGELADRTQAERPVKAWGIVNDFVVEAFTAQATGKRPEDPEPPPGDAP